MVNIYFDISCFRVIHVDLCMVITVCCVSIFLNILFYYNIFKIFLFCFKIVCFKIFYGQVRKTFTKSDAESLKLIEKLH